ncbi:MAG: DTW domain-containing protein [Sandaracinaceae bacterium]|nr:DTW domain-containing protein [Sandaracinaceae bacterium]
MTHETPETPTAEHRETCFRCFKPRSTCVCGLITAVPNRVGVSVLQHPRERAHPLGTARFVELGLSNSEVIVAFTGDRDLHVPMQLPEGTGLLYPSPDATDLEQATPAERPRHLLVLDGTWSQARALYRQNPWLAGIPHFQLSPEAPSRYRIRREPRPEFVSTLESVLLALRILEPETEGFEGLLSAFDSLVDTQIEHHARAKGAGEPKRQKRVRRERLYRGVPRWLAEDAERLVGLYAEAVPPATAGPSKPGPLLQLVAMRFATGERFEAMIRPAAGLPGDAELATIGLTRADFDDALPGEQLAHALDGFLRPGDVGLAWNRSTPSLMHDATGIAHRMRLLKPVLRELGPLDEHGSLQSLDVLASLARTELGEADQALDTEGLRGRAARRLANLLRVAHATRLRGLKAPTLE